MAIINDLIDEHQHISNGLTHWRRYWNDIARYVLPQTETFYQHLEMNPGTGSSLVATMPVASDKAKNIYDMTSIWAIERLTSGVISLKTPETGYWHGLDGDDLFGGELDHMEMEAMERVRDFLFRVRSNPASGFWSSHKAAMRSMTAFGDGWQAITEKFGDKVPWRYEFCPLNEMNPAVDDEGRPNTNYRVMRWSAYQLARRFGDKAGKKVIDYANDPKRRHNQMILMHGVRPKSDEKRGMVGIQKGRFESHYCLPDEKHHIGEGGFYDFPYIRYAWAASGNRAQSEGPVAYALGEVKSLNEMARNELIASQAAIRPPLGMFGKNYGRINFNPGASNPNLVSPDGKPLFAPLTTGARPDFAQAVIEARRNAVRETMYLNLWQILIENPEQTATEAMIRAQEKGELLGPVGISLNHGLHTLVDREISITARRGGFDQGSPLELPESLQGREVVPRWTSPLDRLRQIGELVGMQRLAEFAGALAEATQDPSIMQRLDAGMMIEKAREVLGAPVESLRPAEEAQQAKASQDQLNQLMALIEGAKGGGEAVKTLGEAAQATAAGAQATQSLGANAAQLPAAAQPGGAV